MTQLKYEIVQLKEDVKALKQTLIHIDSGTRNVAQLFNIQWPSLTESPSLGLPAPAQQVTEKKSQTKVIVHLTKLVMLKEYSRFTGKLKVST